MEIIIRTFILGGIILLLIIVAVMVYKIYIASSFVKEPVILLKDRIVPRIDFVKKYSVNQVTLPKLENGDVLGFSYAFSIYLDNALESEKWGSRFDKLKTIIDFSPGVYYHPMENYFEFNIQIQDNVQMPSYQTIRYMNPPLQKWLNLVVVFSSNMVQVFQDNQLIITKRLRNPPIVKARSMQVGESNNNIKGQIGPIIYWPYPLRLEDIPNATKMVSI